MKKYHFNVYIPASDQNPTARSEFALLPTELLPDAEIVFVETFDDEDDK